MSNIEQPAKTKKNKGPIRWGAVLPFTVFVLLASAYTHFFMDANLRSLGEWGLTKALGVEVNIAKVETSFWRAHLSVHGIEITDSETPEKNSVGVGDIRFGMSWDALLRAKILVNEAVVEQIEFGKPRKSKGWVKPPEPPPVDDGKPSAVDKLKGAALNEVKTQYKDNVFGDIAAILGGAGADVQLDKIKDSLTSKKMAEDLDAQLKAKQNAWNDRLKTLPKAEDFQKLNERLKAVKTSHFKSPEELQKSLQELDAIFKETDAKIKALQAAGDDLKTDLAKTQDDVKNLEAQIKLDIKKLEAHFKIPHIDAKELTLALFHRYLDKYLDKLRTYQALAEKYVPPNLLQKGNNEPDPSMQPRPRAKGVTYEFGRPNSYPLLWIKHMGVSSQAGTSPYSGNIRGDITDISTNQLLTGKPTVATIAGDFPSAQISGFSTRLTVDNRKAESLIELVSKVNSYPIEGRELVGGDVSIAFKKATGSMDATALLKGLKDLDLKLSNRFSSIDYQITAKNEVVDDLLKKVFAGLPTVTLDAQVAGLFPKVNLDANSNLGPELQKGLEREVNAKIAEARVKIQKYVDDEVGKTKAQIDAEITKLRAQTEGELKKLQAQAEAEKKQAESQVEKAKKDAEDQGKKQVEDAARKAADELKKRLGL